MLPLTVYTSSSVKSPEFLGEKLVGDGPLMNECSKVSHSLAMGFYIYSYLFFEEVFLMMAEQSTDL